MREQIKILIIMAAALAAVIIYAVIPKDISVGNLLLKKISLAELRKPESKDTTATAKQQKAKKAIRNHTFLFIGDSMVEGLSRRLGDYAKENGHKLYTVIWYSSTTEKWATTNTLEHLVAEYKPTYILLCLGSNELFINDLDVREKYIQQIVRKIGNHPFVWIGPAEWNGDTGILDIIARYSGKGHYFNSRGLGLQRGPDHYHPTWDAAASWMDKVAAYMSGKEAADAVKLNIPKGHHKATLTKLLQPSFKGY